ncbi:hypothetical protein ACQP2K_43670 [Microbispora siamensis]
MPLISRSDCEVNVHDGTFFIVDVSLSWDPGEPSDRRRLRLSAEDELVSLTLEVWDDEPGDQREAWADVVTRVFHSETGEVCAAELYTGVCDGFLLLGEPERPWNVRVYTRTDDGADPRERFLVQFWPPSAST